VAKKKNLALCWHRVCEAIAAGIIEFYHIPSEQNCSDWLTKAHGPQVYTLRVKPFFTRHYREQGECQDDDIILEVD
jgi:hypothetical protein